MGGFSVFPYSGKKRYFSCSPLSIVLCNVASICKYKAYWHMKFSLINGFGTCKNNIHSYSFFLKWFTNIIIIVEKKLIDKCKEKFFNFTAITAYSNNKQGNKVSHLHMQIWLGIKNVLWNICRCRLLTLFAYFLLLWSLMAVKLFLRLVYIVATTALYDIVLLHYMKQITKKTFIIELLVMF